MSFGRLRERLWNNYNGSIRVKGKIYRSIILYTLLYGTDTWTVYRRHEKKLRAFMMRHLRSIMKIRWQDKVTNIKVLKLVGPPFYGRPPHQDESPLDRTSFEDAHWPPSETGSLLAATRRTTIMWPPMSPLQRHN